MILPFPTSNEPCPYCINETPDVTTFCDVCGRMLCYTFTYPTRPSHTVYISSIASNILNVGLGYACEALFDSGASNCLVHGKIADTLGINLTNVPSTYFTGIAPNPILAYEIYTRIGIRQRYFPCRVYFSYDLDDNNLSMLGQEFFQYCTFTLDEINHRVTLREKSSHLSRYKFCRLCGIVRKQPFSAFCRECGSPLQTSTVKGREFPFDLLNAWNR